MKASLIAFFLLSAIAPYASAQGTVQLTLATSEDETAATVEVPFNKLFDASSGQKGVSIQVSSGSDVPVEQDQITCQCFSDTAGTKPLGDTFTNEFPGTKIGEEPVQIGSIYCSDAAGLKQQMGGSKSNAGNGDGNNAQAPPSPPPVSSPPAQAPAPPATTLQTSTAATSPTATSTAAISGLNSPPPSSGSGTSSSSSSSSSSSNNGGDGSGSGNNNGPAVILKFLLSSDPSDDSATQTSVAIDRSIVPTDGKQASGIEVFSLDGPKVAGELVCQAFADEKAQEPLGMGFGMARAADFGAAGVTAVGAVGCAMLSGTEFGGMVGLVAS
ncbi:MAG: hypothetical protein Q9167_002883 [Letrouitia subvulpina]